MEKALRKQLPGGAFKGVSQKRSQAMAAVKDRDNKTTERRLRLALVRAGISGWKLHSGNVLGSPDFFFPEYKLAVFVDGCFWHGCPQCGHYPKTNSAFWKTKIERNRERDGHTTLRLQESGYKVLRFWEHELQDALTHCVRRIQNELVSS